MSTARAFIVRPFGTQQGIDFNRVSDRLISPVLERLNIVGGTTEVIAWAGNIRVDMFERLALADIVIADISIHNANVFYELGIRHSLRPRTTILIRARAKTRPEATEVPFDLKTDRYLEYDADKPDEAQPLLADALEQSLAARHDDSPVFLLVPGLEPTDPERLHPIPPGFSEEVVAAQRSKDRPMLAVLADEAGDVEWGLGGLRLVARAQFALKAWPDALATYEAIRDIRPDDPDANLSLGTVYLELGKEVESAAALQRVSGQHDMASAQEAEALALLGRNAKNLWVRDWNDLASEAAKHAAALRSPHLETARTYYDQAFSIDQNHWYSGVNALALTAVLACLIDENPDVWGERFDDDDKAKIEANDIKRGRDELAGAVSRSLSAEAFRDRRRGEPEDIWAMFTRADLRLLTSQRPAYVTAAYEQARTAATDQEMAFAIASAARQVELYRRLGVFTDNVNAALKALDAPADEASAAPAPVRSRVLVFSGHRIDARDRKRPRFPASSEGKARDMIRRAVVEEQAQAGSQPIMGFAAGASGGDILFHEVCAELGIPTTLLLPLPEDEFAAESVADAGAEWIERFLTLTKRLEVRHLTGLPDWMAGNDSYTIWQRGNRWILHTAMSLAEADITLIVLWDGKGGDGPGGTENMVELAKSRHVKTVQLPASELV
ncbi:MAG: tetratricopeptide repeat-containing protein [Solirubrobacteraceae bacterium]